MRSLAVLAVAVVGLLAGAARAGSDSPSPGGGSIVVTGQGSVPAVPDRAHVSFGVTTQAKTAAAALHANAAELAKVIAALKERGIAAGDVQTEAVLLSQRSSASGEVVGYAAENAVDVTVRDLSTLGPLIDAAVGAGANQVSGPDLVRSDAAALYREALRAAVADARAKGQAIASSAGVTLGPVTDVTEGSGSQPEPQTARTARSPTPIEPGTQLVQATVTVAFAVG